MIESHGGELEMEDILFHQPMTVNSEELMPDFQAVVFGNALQSQKSIFFYGWFFMIRS
jgi:hypothetical protein